MFRVARAHIGRMATRILSAEQLHQLALDVLVAAGTATENAEVVAEALTRAELGGFPQHGVGRLPAWADEVEAGQIDGWAQPEASLPSTAAVRVDARGGFAAPAVAYGLAAAEEAVQQAGLAAVAIINGSHFGVSAHQVGRLADRGLVALMFGTDGLCFACPRQRHPPLILNPSGEALARIGEILCLGLTGAQHGTGTEGCMIIALDPGVFAAQDVVARMEHLLSRHPPPDSPQVRTEIEVSQDLLDDLLLRTRSRRRG